MSGFANLLDRHFRAKNGPVVHFSTVLYHVISRGNQRQKIHKNDLVANRFKFDREIGGPAY
jgi:hypothetical protein